MQIISGIRSFVRTLVIQ